MLVNLLNVENCTHDKSLEIAIYPDSSHIIATLCKLVLKQLLYPEHCDKSFREKKGNRGVYTVST